jgi:hypothetical protein
LSLTVVEQKTLEALIKSAVGTSVNLLIFLDNCVPDQLRVQKLDETIETLKKIVTAYKP